MRPLGLRIKLNNYSKCKKLNSIIGYLEEFGLKSVSTSGHLYLSKGKIKSITISKSYNRNKKFGYIVFSKSKSLKDIF